MRKVRRALRMDEAKPISITQDGQNSRLGELPLLPEVVRAVVWPPVDKKGGLHTYTLKWGLLIKFRKNSR